MKKWPQSPWPLLLVRYLFFPAHRYNPLGHSLQPVDWARETLFLVYSLVYKGSVQCASTGWKWTAMVLQLNSGRVLKNNSSGRKSLPVVRTSSTTPGCSVCLEKEMARSSAGLEVLVPEGRMLPPEDITMIFFNWKLRLSPGHFGYLKPLSQQARKSSLFLC